MYAYSLPELLPSAPAVAWVAPGQMAKRSTLSIKGPIGLRSAKVPVVSALPTQPVVTAPTGGTLPMMGVG